MLDVCNPPLIGIGGTPPAYLSVAGHEQCIDERYATPENSFTSVCLPETKPADCRQESWEALQEMKDNDVLEDCE